MPADSYNFIDLGLSYEYVPCNYYPVTGREEWTVTVTAPSGTVHEAFFDPVALASGVGASPSNGVLKPASFTLGGKTISMSGLKWHSGAVTLTLSPYADLSGREVEFIALDGSVALRLAGDSGVGDSGAGTVTWALAKQPWKAGDKLMLRIKGTSPAPRATATPVPTPTVGPTATPTPVPTPTVGPVETVDAQEAVMRDACANAEVMDSVDTTVVIKHKQGDVTFDSVSEYRVSGSDFHMITYDQQGNAMAEVIVVGNQDYSRMAFPGGEWGEWQIREISGIANKSSDVTTGSVGEVDAASDDDNAFCGDWALEDIAYLGVGKVDDIDASRFGVVIDEDLPGENDSYEKWEYLIDDDGTILQLNQETFIPEADGAPSQRIDVITTYSGIGEPNVITAPDIDGQ